MSTTSWSMISIGMRATAIVGRLRGSQRCRDPRRRCGHKYPKVSLEDGLTVMFDLSFAREFDTNFALRLADFDKFEG